MRGAVFSDKHKLTLRTATEGFSTIAVKHEEKCHKKCNKKHG